MRAAVFIIAISSLFHSAGASSAAAEILPERILESQVQREIVSPFLPVLFRASSVHFSLARGRGAPPEFIWPVRGIVVFHMNANSSYEGINIAAAQGTIVKAAADGVVVYSGKEPRGYGQLVFIDHGHGWITAYVCNSRLLVKRGNQVRQGQSIATMERSGAMSFLQLHFEIGRWGKPLNTWNYLPKL
jgi:murein DD-endopeptidase MepM/ murein hydrolase activator NlpD